MRGARHVRRAAELAGLPLLYGGLRLARFYRRSFHETSPHVYRAADRLGVYPVLDHYHEPLVRPSTNGLRPRRELPAIDFRLDAQLELLRVLRYGDELEAIPDEFLDRRTPFYRNLAFPPGDAEILYGLVRHFAPQRIVEVGSGESTKFAARALRANGRGELLCIEPYEHPEFEGVGFDVDRRKVEDVEPERFSQLAAGDILFVDSSHVARAGGDVVHLFTAVLPALASGVIVHVHDIFTPRDYPPEWLRRRWFWDEQYVLEAMLAASDRYEILLALNLLYHEHRAELDAACPVLARGQDPREPGSFWLRVR